MTKPGLPGVLYVSTFPPRECGIATFTQDLTTALEREFPGVNAKILALNADGVSLYNYPDKVAWQLGDSDLQNYFQAAKQINQAGDIKLINIQHEYGIFGGPWGSYLLAFMELVKKPLVVTFHTVLPRPDRQLKKTTQDVIDKAAGVIVMTKHAAQVLGRTYGLDKKKPLAVIPHGVHHIAFPSKTQAKNKLHLAGRTVLSTFGMLNRDKGIEYAIAALPEVVAKYPDVLYLVLGATHPLVVKHEGEVYRNKLVRLVKKLGLENHVKFYNKYLTLEELIDFLKATDIYLSPTLNPKQAVSGTLSYALSCACPVISTANQYAKDVISRQRGLLVDFASAPAIAKALGEMLADPLMRQEMKKDAYFYSRHMTWQNVALSYFKFFNQFAVIKPRQSDKLPEIDLRHLRTLTDNFGIVQFARHTKPDLYSGYCLDDNARALIGCVKLYQQQRDAALLKLIKIYFAYLKFSQRPNGHFNDFINYNRSVNRESPPSDDSLGRALWALGVAGAARQLPPELTAAAKRLWNRSFKLAGRLQSSRALSFAILGLTAALSDDVGKKLSAEPLKILLKKMADKLLANYRAQTVAKSADNWRWFDDHLTYSNYKIPEALLAASKILGDKQYRQVALESLDWLADITFDKGYYNAIGQDGWYFRSGKRAYFDQQPEDAASAVEALVAAYQLTGWKKYADQAQEAFAWFLGKNHLNQMVYDEATGGCYDGLGRHSLNFNQGAESTISYFLARLAIEACLKK